MKEFSFRPVSLAVLTLLWCSTSIAATAEEQASNAAMGAAALAPADASTRADILRLVSGIESAFNRRDLGAFMDSYANAPDVEYVYQGRAVRGIEAIRREYLTAFFAGGTDRESGPPESARLRLVVSELNAIGKDYAIATLRILLADDKPGAAEAAGVSTIVVRRARGHWRIVYDHSSMLDTSDSRP